MVRYSALEAYLDLTQLALTDPDGLCYYNAEPFLDHWLHRSHHVHCESVREYATTTTTKIVQLAVISN